MLKNIRKKSLLALLVRAEHITVRTYRSYSYFQLKKWKLQLLQSHLKVEKCTEKESPLVCCIAGGLQKPHEEYICQCDLRLIPCRHRSFDHRYYFCQSYKNNPLSPMKPQSPLLFSSNLMEISPCLRDNMFILHSRYFHAQRLSLHCRCHFQ